MKVPHSKLRGIIRNESPRIINIFKYQQTVKKYVRTALILSIKNNLFINWLSKIMEIFICGLLIPTKYGNI